MQILVNTDNNIVGDERLTEYVTSTVESAVRRFSDRLTRVEVHLKDVNSHKSADNDKHCALEARLAGLDPLTVKAEGGSVEEALDAATEKLVKTIDRYLGQRDDPKGRTSFAGENLSPPAED